MIKASNIMTFGVATIRRQTPLIDALKLIRAHRIGALPVVDEQGGLVGMVSEADFFGNGSDECMVKSLLELAQPERDDQLRKQSASTIMNAEPLTIESDSPVTAAADKIARCRVGHLPVIEKGKVVGMLSRTDLLNYLANPERF